MLKSCKKMKVKVKNVINARNHLSHCKNTEKFMQ